MRRSFSLKPMLVLMETSEAVSNVSAALGDLVARHDPRVVRNRLEAAFWASRRWSP